MKLAAPFVLILISGCMGNIAAGTDGGAGGGNGTGTGGGSGGGTAVPSGLPCEVAQLLSSSCVSCHGSPLAGGAPTQLLTRADLLAISPRDSVSTEAVRSLARMRDTTSPMPPGGGLSAAQIDAFAAWVNAGTPEGSCGGIDAGAPEPTCGANLFLPLPVVSDPHDGRTMAPGMACISCHSGQDFQGQNPGGQMSAPQELYQFMGTVFRTPWEQDLCAPSLGIAARVEILDPNGAIFATLPVNSGGNFFGDGAGARPATFTARVVTATGTRTMTTPQTNGDCNTCHTVLGAGGALGRIYLP